MLALDFLRVPFARAMHVGVQMPGVGAPMIGIVAGQPERLEQRFELQKDFVFATTKNVCQDLSYAVIDGMPEPAWVPFVANKRPHFIHFCFASSLNVHGYLLGGQREKKKKNKRKKKRKNI